MSEGRSTQVDSGKELHELPNDNYSRSPSSVKMMKADAEDSGKKIESPTPEKSESGKKSIDNYSRSPSSVKMMKADAEDSGKKIESPTPEKSESGKKSIVISSLAKSSLAERYKDRLAEQLLGVDDETDDEDNDIISPADSQCSVTGSVDIFGMSPNGLLEKHKNLLNLFNRMESSIRLLHLRKKMTTFKNIATQVEVLTKRKFLYTHLAQMKHLFPEAIQINRILLHDEKSLCMYADMEITLVMDVVECRNPDQSISMAIREAFESKLLSFLGSHHKDINIPEATLPAPFNLREKLYLEAPHNGHSVEPLLESSSENGFSNASHFPQSFQKHMSLKIISEGTERTRLLSDPVEVITLSADDTEVPNRSSNKHISVPSKTNISDTPNRHLISYCEKSTPKQGTSNTPLMAKTPAMETPKRPLPTPLGKLETSNRQGSEARSTSSARRSLIMFSPAKFDKIPSSDHDVDTSKLDKDGATFATEHEVTAGKCLFPEEPSAFANLLVENDEGKTNQVSSTNSQEKLDSLRVTFDIVCDFSRSTKNSLITKQELFHNILANNLEIEEIGEIEEQLRILEDLSPDWISKNPRGGDILYSIKQIPDQKSVRERLVEVI